MKKIFVLIGICIVLVAMPMTAASPLLKSTHISDMLRHGRQMSSDGNFTGEFALKNDTGIVPLGTLGGSYAGEQIGTFTGVWSLYDGTATGTINGWYLGCIFFGSLNTTGVAGSSWFGGLYRVNATDNTFEAGAIIFENNSYLIRYAMGTI